MITTNTDSTTLEEIPLTGLNLKPPLVIEKDTIAIPVENKLIDLADNQLLLHGKFTTHNPKAGLNPLVDVAGYLFSTLGKLKNLKTYSNLPVLQKELTTEIYSFQESAQAKGYRSEYTLVSRYALCATFDDVISSTPWGCDGQWDNYSLLSVFNSEGAQQERFFLILERIIKEPALYIDVMEFMYICLSLGYQGSYRGAESHQQLEKITHSLYKRICAYHGDFTRTLSPFPIRAFYPAKKPSRQTPYWLVLLMTTVIILSLFVGLGSVLDSMTSQAYHALGN